MRVSSGSDSDSSGSIGNGSSKYMVVVDVAQVLIHVFVGHM